MLPSASVSAQVSISLGVQELYDNNIFLEDDKTVLPSAIEDAIANGQIDAGSIEQFDGDENDDFITNPSITLSSALPLTPHLDTSAEGKLGAYFFADESDENRITLDATLKTASKETLLSRPWYFEVADQLSSDSDDITVAEGSVARQSETNEASAVVGIKEWEFMPKTDLGVDYTFVRHDFLGEFLFDSRDDDEREAEGSDYFSHGANAKVAHHFTDRVDGHIRGGTEYLDFTSVDTNDVEAKSEDELDRLDSKVATGVMYRVSEALEVRGEAGASFSHFSEEGDPEIITVVNPDGSISEFLEDSDQDENSFDFDLQLSYTPEPGMAFTAGANQSSGINIDGDRLTVRRFLLNGSRRIGDRLEFVLGGLVTQYDEGGSLSNSSDRYEGTALVRYALTEAIALSIGYNYANQDATEDSFGGNVFDRDDYEVHRVFLSLDAGLVGVKS